MTHYKSRQTVVCGLVLGCLMAGVGGRALHGQSAATRPNILLIVADDLGFADLGVYGSEIRTPNIDQLATEGLLFTQFHTAPLCAPTRAMLLSGNNNHVAGMGSQFSQGAMQQIPGFESHLSDRIVPFPRLLRDAGYDTYTVGKWHLGDAPEHSPRAAGFQRSFQLLHGAANHFDATGIRPGGSLYRADGELAEYPAGEYSTTVFTDRLIEFIETSQDSDRPFFAFAAYTSPHWPLQVPEEDLNLYRGRYDAGYDRLREQRFESLQSAGIIPGHWTLPPRNDAITPWADLSPDEQRRESRKMELYAAMVDNLDRHVGRLLEAVRANDLYEDTVVIFMGDNGAAAEDFYNGYPHSNFQSYLRANYDNAYENMGKPSSFISYGPQWAEAGSAPFSRHKTYTREGGLVAPMIVAGRGVERRGEQTDTYATVMDLAPTILEWGQATYPTDGSVQPMRSQSMTPLLTRVTNTVHDDQYVTTLYHGGQALVRRGRWKLVNLEGPFSEDSFELFDLQQDPGETTNLADAEQERFAEMLALWRSERQALGILLPEDF